MTATKHFIGIACICALAIFCLSQPAFSDTIFNNENGNAVINAAPLVPTQFNVSDFMTVTAVRTYHWNNGKGAPGGTISIKNQAGKTVYNGSVTVQSKFYWYTEPKLVFPPGTYTINVSAPQTWSYNAASGNRGFALVNAEPIPSDQKGQVLSYFQGSSGSDDKGPVALPRVMSNPPKK